MAKQARYPIKPHSSGQARVKIAGKVIYLGKFGSPESHAKFHRLMAELHSAPVSPEPEKKRNRDITIAELVDAYLQWRHGKYKSSPNGIKAAVRPLLEHYADTQVSEFGPLKLLAVQQRYIELKYSRSVVNKHVNDLRTVFKWGVSREFVDPMVLVGLQSVRAVHRGEAVDRPKVTTVSDAHVSAIQDHVSAPVWAMIQLQIHTGMRPSEVCRMRTVDVNTNDQDLPESVRPLCWSYRPEEHKTAHRSKSRLILIGPQAQKILAGWMKADRPKEFIFQPRDGLLKSKKLTFTDKTIPSRLKERYSPRNYGSAIYHACITAGIPSWGPNRLRHNAATTLRRLYGIEIARVILGHASLTTTQIYAEIDVERAAKAMIESG